MGFDRDKRNLLCQNVFSWLSVYFVVQRWEK